MPSYALVGDSQGEALWPRVRKALGSAVVFSRAERGWTEQAYVKEGKLLDQITAARPDVVVIELGGNNANKSARYGDSVNALWQGIRTRLPHAQIVWLGPALATKEPFATNKRWTRDWQIANLQNRANTKWVDSFPYTQTGHRDGVHFSGPIYDRWANEIVSLLRGQNAIPLLAPISDASPLERQIFPPWGPAIIFGSLILFGFYRYRKMNQAI